MFEKVEPSHKGWLSLVDKHNALELGVKFDGCIHWRQYHNGTMGEEDPDSDYLHICDIDEMIKRLQEVREHALKHFGDKWPD